MALAQAFGVRSRQVRVVSGERSRTKIIEVDGDEEQLSVRLAELLGPAPQVGHG